jgi:hypothetical protein
MDAIVISIVAYAITLSLGQSFGKHHNYQIDPNQELIALGSANLFSSFFYCFTSCPALSRTSVSDKVGGKTQITCLVSSAVILVVLLFIGGIFYSLPKVSFMFIQINDWHFNNNLILIFFLRKFSVHISEHYNSGTKINVYADQRF